MDRISPVSFFIEETLRRIKKHKDYRRLGESDKDVIDLIFLNLGETTLKASLMTYMSFITSRDEGEKYVKCMVHATNLEECCSALSEAQESCLLETQRRLKLQTKLAKMQGLKDWVTEVKDYKTVEEILRSSAAAVEAVTPPSPARAWWRDMINPVLGILALAGVAAASSYGGYHLGRQNKGAEEERLRQQVETLSAQLQKLEDEQHLSFTIFGGGVVSLLGSLTLMLQSFKIRRDRKDLGEQIDKLKDEMKTNQPGWYRSFAKILPALQKDGWFTRLWDPAPGALTPSDDTSFEAGAATPTGREEAGIST